MNRSRSQQRRRGPIGGGYYIPLANWKRSYDGGYSIEQCYTREWSTAVAPPLGPQIGSDTTKSNATSGTEELCPTIEWPAQHEWTARQYRRGYGGPRTWMGSLIYGQRDFSGLHYRRNRFYDSEQGRFTQEDPIGLSGGINLYGFANGDPVTYSDPYGLCPPEDNNNGPWCSSPLRWFLGVVGADHEWADGHARATYEMALAAGAAKTGGLTLGMMRRGTAVGAHSVTVSRSRHPQSAAHIDDAQAAGHPSVLTIDRAGAAARRRAALKGTPAKAGSDRDEYPPAMTAEGGAGSSVRYVDPSDNRGAGACVGAQCRNLPDGTKIRIRTEP